MFIPGTVTLWVALIALVASTLLSWRALRGDATARERARHAYSLATFAIVLATAAMLYLILSHDFRLHYVYAHSDMQLPLPYLISALWAGQEGSLLFWLLCGLLIGLPLARSAKDDEPLVLIPYNLVQLALLAILLKQGPFRYLEGLPPGQMPGDGQGLNPLLQNPWMTIHPPIMFVGYAAAAAPFALAVAALWRRQYDTWVRRALPWAILSLVTLGCAILLGGYWAYITLGWGGYWGWDPVENASLVPWITSIVLVHTMLLQQVRGRFSRLNFGLSILTFVLVIYATFLTRSGVLADFSVHSFVDLGISGWLVATIFVFLLSGMAMLIWRWRDIPTHSGDEPFWTRSVLTVVGIGVLLLAALVVLVGTSWPLLTRLGGQASQVGPGFYNQVSLPIGIALALLLAVVGHLGWQQSGERLPRRLLPAAVLALAATAGAVILGARGPGYLLLLATSTFAATSVIWNLASSARARQWMLTGGYLTHLGFALMLAGIITSSAFDREARVRLPEGTPVEALGRTLTFRGIDERTRPGKRHMLVEIRESSGSTWTARPLMWNNPKSGQLVANPDLRAKLFYDTYVAPIEWKPGRPSAPGSTIEIGKGETAEIAGGTLTFQGFERSEAHGGDAPFAIGVKLLLARQGGEHTLIPALSMTQTGMTSTRVDVPGVPGAWIEVGGMNADLGRVRLTLAGVGEIPGDPGEPASFAVEIAIKPGINLLWLGLVILLAGSTVALVRRSRDAAGS